MGAFPRPKAQLGSLCCERLESHFKDDQGEPWYLFGNGAYPLSPWLMAPFKGNLSGPKREFNKNFGSVRVSVEWGIGRVSTYWPLVDCPKQQQLLLSSSVLAKQYVVATLLTNCRTCFRGNGTPRTFGVSPPSLGQNLAGEG